MSTSECNAASNEEKFSAIIKNNLTFHFCSGIKQNATPRSQAEVAVKRKNKKQEHKGGRKKINKTKEKDKKYIYIVSVV